MICQCRKCYEAGCNQWLHQNDKQRVDPFNHLAGHTFHWLLAHVLSYINHIEYTYKIQIKKHILPFLVQVDDTYCVLHKATFNINL